MAHSSEEIKDEQRMCSPCSEEGETNVGSRFCMECKEVFCITCAKYHRNFKMSKGHKLIGINELSVKQSQDAFLADVGKCGDHPERDVEFFCKNHDSAICSLCSSFQHNMCDISEIGNKDIDAKTLQRDSESLITHMKAAMEHLEYLQKLRMEIGHNFNEGLSNIRKTIVQMRDCIVKLMDKLVSHIFEVTKQLQHEQEEKISAEMAQVETLKEETEQKVTLLNTVGQHGSKKHKFVSVNMIKKQFEETNRQISEEDMNLKEINADLEIVDHLKKLSECLDVKNIVHVKVIQTDSSHMPLTLESVQLEDHSSVMNDLRLSNLVKVEEHRVHSKAKSEPYYCGVSMHRDGRLILTDYNCLTNCLCLYNPNNRDVFRLIMQSNWAAPFSAVQIDDTDIAFSMPGNNIIHVVSVIDRKMTLKNAFITQYQPWTIVALSNAMLAVAWSNPPAFGVVDIRETELVQKSYLEKDTNGQKFKPFQYLSVDEDRQQVIQSCTQDKSVCCFSFEGKPVFKYTHARLAWPQGIAQDRCGNIYVCDYSQGSIHKLSPTGGLITIFTEGIPSNPQAICSDIMGTGFWVTRNSSPCEKVTYLRLDQ